jgi:hypothetical protein
MGASFSLSFALGLIFSGNARERKKNAEDGRRREAVIEVVDGLVNGLDSFICNSAARCGG